MVEIHSPVTAYWYRGRPLRLDSPASLLAVPGLSLPDKVRMGMVLAWLRWHPRPPWHRHDTVTAHAWLERWMGRRAYEALWRSLLEGKFGRRYRDVSLAWFAARIYKRTSRLGYFRGGFQAWTDAVREKVEQGGTEVGFNTPLTLVEPQGGTLAVRSGQRSWEGVQAVLYTGSPNLLGRIAPALPATYRARLAGEATHGRRGADGSTGPVAAERRLLAEHPGRCRPAVSGLGGTHRHDSEGTSTADTTFSTWARTLNRIIRGFPCRSRRWPRHCWRACRASAPGSDDSWVRRRWLNRTAWAQPIPVPGSGRTRLPLHTPLSGLYLATMSQVWPWDRGTNYAVRIGKQAARQDSG